ncbi:hypothetical protein NKW54_08615 [Acetobacter cerevisiae]|uniref:DUF5082 domain-containing protein n=1 Tax=Acetobacter cerevisiae TaxID=178900 RepID=A0ABT1ERI9_9PROT|nr:hypothetical protein [Acetobacter cerevisiae]MCP1246001.1 hypothetical protein [Acetobacter cerevisiae]MCP1255719.1 hypothetical protein [Acetobacter cerevisiae]
MTIEEARRNKMLQDLRQSLDELINAHNALFEQTEKDSGFIWDELTKILEGIDALKRSVLEQSNKSSSFHTKAKGISDRVSDLEARQKDSEADIKRLQHDLSSYQIGCGRTIIEIQMRLDRLEKGKG